MVVVMEGDGVKLFALVFIGRASHALGRGRWAWGSSRFNAVGAMCRQVVYLGAPL